MNVLIICFSQTGNTQKLADRISKGIVDSGNRCITMEMKHANIDEIPNYDLIGIGTPTFFYREPVNVGSFIKKCLSRTENTVFCSVHTEASWEIRYISCKSN